MDFGDLKSKAGQQLLNNYLADKSYLSGYAPSAQDFTIFDAMGVAPSGDLFNAVRWFNHIASFSASERTTCGAAAPTAAPAKAAATADEDDFDMFGDEEDDEEVAARNAQRVADYNAKKAAKGKPALVAKSSVLLDCKPWDDETDMAALEAKVRTIEMEGLVWGVSKLVPVAYGLKKLQIGCVIEDDKVSTEVLEEKILEFEDYCQSVDIAAFNKI